MKFFKMLKADWMKTKHTPIRSILYSTPIICAIFLIMYNKNIDKQIQNYAILINFISVILPMGIALISALIVEQEHKAGSFKGIFVVGQSRTNIYMSKLIFVIISICVNIIIVTLLVSFGLKFIMDKAYININLFTIGAILMCIGASVLCTFYVLISFKFGIGASLSFGAIGVLITAILGETPLGYKVWMFIPWTLPVKLAELPGIFLKGANIPYGFTVNEYFKNQFYIGTISSITFLIIVIKISIFWFNRWDGRDNCD